MARYRRFGRWGGKRSYPSEQARRHIEEARQFSAEVGGVDNDVKQFFFSLPPHELHALFHEYGRRHGEDKRQYAEETYKDWKTGRRKMSGLVAQRLFDLLPNRMPLPKKYELVRKLWEYFCPKSHEVFYVGSGANTNVLHSRVSAHLEKVVQDYFISDQLSKKFDWLSGGDVQVRQQLQNYFQQLKREFLAQALKERLEVVTAHLSGCPEDHTVQTVRLGNHVVDIKCTHLVEGVPDATTVSSMREEKRKAKERKERFSSAFGCLLMIVVVIVLLKACSK